MADVHTPEQRSYNMSRIHSKNTKPEELVRKFLFSQGFRYRKNDARLPGKPDIVITKHKLAIFCDSDYWHGYDWENRHQRIKSNREYWIPKIERNMQRDKEVTAQLQAMGWTVLRFWEWQIKKHLDECINTIMKAVEVSQSKEGVSDSSQDEAQ